MLKKTKAQGYSLRIVAIIVIALIALIVMIVIHTKSSANTVAALESCELRGGKCTSEKECSERDGKVIEERKCEDSSFVCCYNI